MGRFSLGYRLARQRWFSLIIWWLASFFRFFSALGLTPSLRFSLMDLVHSGHMVLTIKLARSTRMVLSAITARSHSMVLSDIAARSMVLTRFTARSDYAAFPPCPYRLGATIWPISWALVCLQSVLTQPAYLCLSG